MNMNLSERYCDTKVSSIPSVNCFASIPLAQSNFVQRLRPMETSLPHRHTQGLSIKQKTDTGPRRQAIGSLLFFFRKSRGWPTARSKQSSSEWSRGLSRLLSLSSEEHSRGPDRQRIGWNCLMRAESPPFPNWRSITHFPCVIVGRGSQYFPRNRKDSFRAFLCFAHV